MYARQIIARNLRSLMDEQGIKQEQVAQKGGVSQASVSLALTGSKNQQIDIIEGLARGVGVHISELLSPNPKGGDADLTHLAGLYHLLPPESRSELLRVAERESRYVVQSQSSPEG
jgi:transcriptional regulator with XRE-family HTH domain